MPTFSKTALFVLCFSMLWISAALAAGPVTLNVDIAQGKSKTVRLRNLPKDAVVAVVVESSGDILVALVDSSGYQRFPDIRRPLFLGRVEKRLSFSVSIPETGDYFVMFDNRSGQQPKEVRVTIYAARSSADQLEAADKILREFERELHQIFLFDPFPIGVKQCGVPKPFVDTSGIVLCKEYLHHLYNTLNDRQRTQNALSFSMFHEVGRVLLTKWKHSSFANEEAVDEFATVLMVMLNQEERVIELAEYIVKNPAVSEALIKLFRDDRHPISVQRAGNILRWLKDPELARRWQQVLVPHMQTTLLKRLQQRPTGWTDLRLVEKELAARRKNEPPPTPPDASSQRGRV